jgi:hypothetical protein
MWEGREKKKGKKHSVKNGITDRSFRHPSGSNGVLAGERERESLRVRGRAAIGHRKN